MEIDYYAYRSKMKNWNTHLKVLLCLGTLFLVLLFHQMTVSLPAFFCMGILTIFAGGTPWKVYCRFLTVPLFFMVFSCLAIAVEFAGTAAGDWNLPLYLFYICLTKKSLHTAIGVFLKALAGTSALYMMAFTTPMSELIGVLQKLRLPELFTELMHLTYRYIFILFDVAAQMRTAAKARLGYGDFKSSCRSFAGIAGNLFFAAMRRADIYYNALCARGYEGRMEFLTEESPVMPRQAFGCAAYFTGLMIAGVLI